VSSARPPRYFFGRIAHACLDTTVPLAVRLSAQHSSQGLSDSVTLTGAGNTRLAPAAFELRVLANRRQAHRNVEGDKRIAASGLFDGIPHVDDNVET
jgi:hypothetical protein